jgi:PAS domain S-box-containing protein
LNDASPNIAARLHQREADRLAALASYNVLDTPLEPAFDDLAALASEICDTPIAVVNLIAEGRQWFKAEVGLGVRETPLDSSFCAHAILEADYLEVPDATLDPRFACNPLVTGEPGLRFYAGALLKTDDGLPIGTLCVLDIKPRCLTEQQARALQRLGRQAMSQLELRRALRARTNSEERLRFLDRLADAAQPLTDATAVMATTARLLGQHLGVAVCAYADMEPDQDGFTIRGDWTAPGALSIVGTYRLAGFGEVAVHKLRAGRPLVTRDTLAELGPEQAALFLQLGLKATVCMPLVKDGRLTALMAVHAAVVRDWTEDELALLADTTERSWAHIERIRSEAALQRRSAQLQDLAQVAAAVARAPSLEATLDEITHAARGIIGAHQGVVSLTRGPEWSQAINSVALTGKYNAWRDYAVMPDGSGIYAWLCEENRPVRFTQAELERHPRWRGFGPHAEDHPPMRGWLAAPLVGRDGRNLGLIQLSDKEDGAEFDEADEAMLVQLAGLASAAVEQAQTEAALAEKAAEFEALAENVSQLAWMAEPDGHIFWYNKRWYDYTGTTLETMLGWGWRDVHHPDHIEQVIAEVGANWAKGEPWEGTYLLRGKDGVYRPFLTRAEPIRDDAGRLVRWFGTNTDVSEQRRAEAELHRLNAHLALEVEDRTRERNRIFEMANDLFAVAGFDGYLKTVNPAWSRLLGYTDDELLSRPFAEIVHPDDHAGAAEVISQLRGGGSVRRFEDRLVAADGRHVWIAWAAVPEGDQFYAVGRDVTQDRLRDEALRQAQKMEAVGQLTGGVAHDFNNLLTIIKSSTDLLRRPGLVEERRGRYIDAISDTVDRASRLTGQLLAFARRQALKPEVFDAGNRIRSIADMLHTIVGSRVQIAIDLGDKAALVESDASQFETALVNMTVNARDAMNGEGTLTIQVRPTDAMPAIRGHQGGPGGFVAVSLSDTGAGIPEDQLAQIFEPFFTTKDIGKGTGLGLSQVYGFAKQSGGDVAVESEVGRGTTFTLYLPRAKEQRATDATAGAKPAPAIEDGRGRRVLVVEDNHEVGAFSTQLLQDLGYETTWAANANEALKLLSEVSGFDAVFSDVVMPGMSGLELGQEIRLRHPGLPVVLTSGYSHVLAEEGRHGFELLQKPYAAEELSRILRKVTAPRRNRSG